MLIAARDAVGFVAGMSLAEFAASRLHQNAVIRSLEVIGEAAGKVSAATRVAGPGIPWRETTAMRHRLIHGYADVQLELVWKVVESHLPILIAALIPLVPNEPRPDTGGPDRA